MRHRELTNDQKVFLRAAEILDERGWCQRAFNRDDKLCAYGALGAAIEGNVLKNTNTNWFNNLINRLKRKNKIEDLITWNDTKGRTKEQVQAAFRKAADVR